jgi:predicted dehydrogenase
MTEKTLNVGLIGLGFIGKVHAHAYESIPYCFSNPKVNARLAAVLRSGTGRDQELLKNLGGPLETADPAEFFAQDLDLIDICSPNYLHLEHIIAAADKKRHIYCEKPLALNLKEAHLMVDKTNQAGVLTHSAFVMRYYQAARQARAILASGALGEIYNFRAYLFHNSYMDPQRPISWRLQHALSGGGALADLGVHCIDFVRNLLGDAEWVQCRTRTLISSRPKSAGSSEMMPVDVDDWALCTLGMKNGAQGVVETTRMGGGISDTSRLQVFGSRGSLEIDFLRPHNVLYYDLKRKQTLSGAQDFPAVEGERPMSEIYPPAKLTLGDFNDTHFASIMDFLLNIQENKPSALNFESALKAQEILEAAYLSAGRNGETIQLPLA